MPPVLQVAFDELPAGCPQQVFTGQIWASQGQRHDILQLIPEAISTAWLVIASTRPDTAADVLVDEPAVHQRIERIVRCADANGIQRSIPELSHAVERGRR